MAAAAASRRRVGRTCGGVLVGHPGHALHQPPQVQNPVLGRSEAVRHLHFEVYEPGLQSCWDVFSEATATASRESRTGRTGTPVTRLRPGLCIHCTCLVPLLSLHRPVQDEHGAQRQLVPTSCGEQIDEAYSGYML